MRLTIFIRLICGHLAIIVLIIVMGAYVVIQLNQLNRLNQELASNDSAVIGGIERLLELLLSQVGFEQKYLISKDADFSRQFKTQKKNFSEQLQHLSDLVNRPEKRKLFAEVTESYHSYIRLFEEEVRYIEDRQRYESDRYLVDKEKTLDVINRELNNIRRQVLQDQDRKIQESGQISLHVLKMTSAIALTVIIAGLLVSFLITRSISRSINLLKLKTKDIAAGNFDELPEMRSPPEIKELAEDFNIMCHRLKELDQLKVDFISHVSHELRTPLTAIKEASSMLLSGTYGDRPEKQRELYAITRDECERLIASVSRILDLSRMESNMMEYDIRPCELMPVIQKTVLKLAPIAQRKAINLELVPVQAIPMVAMDAEKIALVLENLIGNALQFTSAGGSVKLNVAVNSRVPRSVLISVADNGSGIPEESLEKIFDKFRRIECGRQTPRGTGLGLSIAKHVITAHGGKIWAQSETDQGSTFFFTLSLG
jgi:two-component system sensor histidine kinase GlrK